MPVKRKENLVEKADSPHSESRNIFSIKNIIVILLLILAIIGWKAKGMFIAGFVNGQPISRWELNKQLTKKYGDQTLDNIINERLILAASRQKGIFVTSSEIDSRVKEIENRLQGKATLDEALKAQSLSKDEFNKQIEVQLSIEKLFSKEATVSSKEIDDYIGKNKEILKSSTDPAALRIEVKSNLERQKIGDSFEKWFADVRKNANIIKYL